MNEGAHNMSHRFANLRHSVVVPLRRFVAVLLIGVATVTLSPAPEAHATDSGGGLTIQPVSSNPTAGVTNRPKFVYKVKPGTVQQDKVEVSNLNTTPRQVRVYVANAFTTSTGGVGVKPNDEAKTGPTEWLKFTTKLGDGVIEIAAKTSATIPFVITVPPNAPPGDLAFGIAVVPVVAAPTPAPGKNTVQVVQAAATLVEMRIDGPLIPIIRIGGFKVDSSAKVLPGFTGGTTKAQFEVLNIGNVKLRTKIHITQRNALGKVIHTEPDIILNNVLPGSKVKLTRSWPNVSYVKGAVQIDITTDTKASESRSHNFWSVGWRTFMLPLILLALLVLLLWLLRRRRRARDAQAAAAAIPGPTAKTAPGTPIDAPEPVQS